MNTSENVLRTILNIDIFKSKIDLEDFIIRNRVSSSSRANAWKYSVYWNRKQSDLDLFISN